MNLRLLQSQVKRWAAVNFGGVHGSGYRPLLGALEELGELAHAHLKEEQGIRSNEDHHADKIDAVGDIVIYLADYCEGQGISLADAVATTWKQVQQLDWRSDPISGGKTEGAQPKTKCLPRRPDSRGNP